MLIAGEREGGARTFRILAPYGKVSMVSMSHGFDVFSLLFQVFCVIFDVVDVFGGVLSMCFEGVDDFCAETVDDLRKIDRENWKIALFSIKIMNAVFVFEDLIINLKKNIVTMTILSVGSIFRLCMRIFFKF